MIITNILGGLGNQMFQYVIGKSLSIKANRTLKLDISEFDNYPLRKFELEYFKLPIQIASSYEINQLKNGDNYLKEKYYHFDKDILNIKTSAYLFGYWQSEKYFEDIRKEILQDFSPQFPLSKKTKKYQQDITSNNSVSLHVRRGDYVSDETTNNFHGTCNLEYYKKAIYLINTKFPEAKFFVFSDDLDWIKKNFIFLKNKELIELSENTHDFEEIYLMSQCKHNIIANSSFSWWGAWLNQNPDKIIISPKKWFNDLSINTDDLIPSSWIRI